MNETIQKLKKYLDLGWNLIPIKKNDKIPITQNGLYDASNDLEQIKEWYKRFPESNWAVVCGENSGVVVIDVDTANGKNGDINIRNLIDRYGGLPKTVSQRSGRGGIHLFFKYDAERKPRKSKLCQDVDFQAEGSYILINPSKREEGEYSWMNGRSPFEFEIAELPDWIYEVVNTSGKEINFTAEGKVPKSQRHLYLLSLGGALRRKGEPVEVIRDSLLAAYTHRCEHGGEDQDPIEHIYNLSERLCRYEPEDPIFYDKDIELTAKMKAVESEVALIGYLLRGTNDAAEVFAALEPYYFLDRECNIVFRTCKRLWTKGVTSEKTNVSIELTKKEIEIDLNRFIDASNIYSLRDAKYHIENIIDSFKNREISAIYKDASGLASRGDQSPKDIISDTSSRTLSLLNDSQESHLFDTKAQIKLVKDLYEKAVLGELALNVPTGIKSLDDQTLGVPRGELTFLAGRPGHFKTQLMLQINRNMNMSMREKEEDGCTLVFSAEMTAAQCAMRNACALGRINTLNLRKGEVDRKKVENALKLYHENIKTFIDDTPSPTGDYMITKALAVNAICPVKAVFFDFIALSGESEQNEVLRLFSAAKKLKALAKLLDIPVIVLSQISRDIEKRNPPIPHEGDLSWSDNLTQLANQIIFTIYPYKFFKNGIVVDQNNPNLEPSPNKLTLFLSKNRDGAADLINLITIPEFGLIVDPQDYELCNELGIHENMFA